MSHRYHTEAINIIDGKEHEAFFAIDTSPENLLVFVHGFNGSAIDTWNRFPSMICYDSFFSNSDIVFYGYPSLHKQLTAHANNFLDFLSIELDFGGGSKSHLRLFIEARGLQSRSYKKVVIVAHSLGAIVAREALLQANRENQEWLEKIHLALFAPAHMGITRVKDLVFDLMDLSLILKFIGRIIEYNHPILLELDKDSQILKKIKDDTQALLATKKDGFWVAKLVVHSSNDKVVSNVQFCGDPKAWEVDDKSHSEVCKPAEKMYEMPIELIKTILQ